MFGFDCDRGKTIHSLLGDERCSSNNRCSSRDPIGTQVKLCNLAAKSQVLRGSRVRL